ncbi:MULTISPECIES: MAPEG family protein [unclassified Methylophaga]|jgi:uncharacterized MAPEG superfamily protein|uniref:MAPEG family protein n=1 Tax=unclassified Methylophaga TaxID=2629249 RepID=UPI000C95D7BA|nr:MULTISPECIES: MAPEG family protein [unclassified Methylophaga]MAK68118.1 hypothetical protein [Methylophaga sp.]MAY17861.1 hypothetical protein [Methylophaga sp.]MBN46933.1 hypothetical protein [Methylophaga sp.]HAO25791.1 hypothetical protein [Methylophaga sp.]HCD03967.1 hypothetical protein [Methylophaga sp.]|tara:strand:- start:32657 stop:33052 length:396 start_codon:yes stop_codon:yes gene_type:complete
MPALFIVLFIVTFFPMILAFIGGYLRYKHVDIFDNRHPREQQSELTGVAARVLAAQKNAWEALIFYSAVTLLAFYSSVNLRDLSEAAILFLACRILHPIFYALDLAVFRSLIFMVGWLSCVYIAIRAFTAV